MFNKEKFRRYSIGIFVGLFFAATFGLVQVKTQLAYAQSLPDNFAKEQIPSSFPDEDELTDTSKVKEEEPKAIDEVAAPSSEKKNVPAIAMGSEAQNAQSGIEEPEESNVENTAPEAPSEDILEKFANETDESADDSLPDVGDEAMLGLEDPLTGGNSPALSMDVGLVDEKTPEELQEEIKSEAFDAAITGTFPLDPDQIGTLLKKYDSVQKATATPPYDPPKPEISVQNLSLDPGIVPVTIKTAMGNITTLNILDVTGAPWPVQDVTWAGDFEIIEPEEGGHIIRITPLSHFARGNLVVRMLTLKTPIILTLETSRDVVQYRVDAKISEYGPFAKASIVRGGRSLVAGSTDQTAILDGAVPNGVVKLNVSGVDGRTTAYSLGGLTYVRTPLTLLSPSWQSSVSSADGMNVYALTSAPVLLLSDGGEFVRATISEKEDLLDE